MLFSLAYYYIGWHYSRAVVDMAGIVLNFRWFFHQFFGVERHLATFFVPFQRLQERSHNPLDFEDMASAFIVTTLMRIVGMVLRAVMIVLGLVAQVVTFALGGVLLLCWVLAPVLLLVVIFSGVVLMLHF
jgi:hypothetical protein